MNPERQQAIDYLRAPANGLWRWAENGTVLVWRDGSTIAFREEIAQILEWLAPNGLPSLGALVFLLAACRGKVPCAGDIMAESNAPLPTGVRGSLLLTTRHQLKLQLEAAIGELARVVQLPDQLKTGLKARCVLAEAVFEPARAERYIQARCLLRGIREPMDDGMLNDTSDPSTHGNYVRQIHIVAEGLKLHTAESLALRLRTGLDALPQQVDESLPVSERARKLIEELSRDRELGAVARAARDLTAAVRLPRRVGQREELAIGGVADLTNRGPLDRLLLSELAHDDLTLSARVALNEALYLRREPPMREPPGTLAILLDSGVRLWGIPRVLAAAVALALVARDKQHREIFTWRAHGKRLTPVDLLSRNGLIQHLGALEPTAHVGDSLTSFQEAVSPGAQNQSVVITHRDALDDAGFRRALAEHPAAPGFVAAVDRRGRFELHACPFGRRPPLCEADLDLAAIFDDKIGVAPIRSAVDPNVPAIFGLQPFPFLLPISGRVDFWTKADNGLILAALNDRRLVQFRDAKAGGRTLATELPAGKTLWMGCVADTVHIVKASTTHRPARLLSFSLPQGPLLVKDLVSGAEVRAVHCYGEVILIIRDADVRAYALSDGRMIGRTHNPHHWHHGRYFRGHQQYYFAAWDGENVKFEQVSLPSSQAGSGIVCVFDRQGLEGPWLLHQNGLVLSSIEPRQYKLTTLTPRADQIRVSRNGHLLYVGLPQNGGCMLDLESGKERNIPVAKAARLDLDAPPPMPTWNLFRAIESIAQLPDGLVLCGRRKCWRKLSLKNNGHLHLGTLAPHEEHELKSKVSFSSPAKRAEGGYLMQVAQWPSGSKAFLDSRGLLHLKSHDPTVPEISLILSHLEVAGWTADGHVCGPQFFFEGEVQSTPTAVNKRLMMFLQRL